MSKESFNNWKQVGFVTSLNDSKVFIKVFNEELLSSLEKGNYVIIANNENGHIAEIEFLGQSDNVLRILASLQKSINLNTRQVKNSEATESIIGAEVFIAPMEFVEGLLDENNLEEKKVVLDFIESGNVGKDVTPEAIFGRHLAILGATGSGKSYTIARLIEESSKFNSKIILFDASGEFSDLENTLHVRLGYDPKPKENSLEVSLPYFELRESDLFAIFKPSGQSQAPKLRQAIKSLKLSKLQPSLGMDGIIFKANKTKVQFETAYQKFYNLVENQNAEFDITRLTRQIANECVFPSRSSLEPLIWGDFNPNDQANCVPMINRIQDIITSNSLSCIFTPGQAPSLFEVMDRFVEDKKYNVLCISLEHLSFEHNAREIVANSLGRHLLDMARKNTFKTKPLVLLLDEAHQFLNERLSSRDNEYPLDSFGLIAKEGRKYGLNISLSTQRPRDIPEDVLSQMGAMLVHRLINQNDRKVIESACGEIDEEAASKIPQLEPGNAILVGVSFKKPTIIKIKMATCRPNSDGPDFQECWGLGKILKNEPKKKKRIERAERRTQTYEELLK